MENKGLSLSFTVSFNNAILLSTMLSSFPDFVEL